MGLVYISAIVSFVNIEKEDNFLVDSGTLYYSRQNNYLHIQYVEA